MTTEEAKLSRIEGYCEAIMKTVSIVQREKYVTGLDYLKGSKDTAEQVLKIIKEEEK